MKKKVLCLLMAIMICVSIVPTYAQAAEQNGAPCYIASKECPEEYITYAAENVSKFVLSVNEGLSLSDISVGTPFSFAGRNADIFYFPIMFRGAIKYLFRVYPTDDGFSAVISEMLAKEIDSLSYLTSADTPMYLILDGTKIVATIGSNTYEFFDYPEDMSLEGSKMTRISNDEYSIRNVKEAIEIQLDLIQPRDVYKNIDLDIKDGDIQGKYSKWCLACCVAKIIAFQTNNSTVDAYNVMSLAYAGRYTDSDSFKWTDTTVNGKTIKGVYSVSSMYGLYPTVLEEMPSNSVLVNEIFAGRPCILAMRCSTGNHAVVLRGWSSLGTWSIWNPWYKGYESFPMDGVYVPATESSTTRSYTAYKAAYNFCK